MTYNEKIKEANYRWRAKNREKYNKATYTYVKVYRIKNKERLNMVRMRNYYYHKEASIFRKILLD